MYDSEKITVQISPQELTNVLHAYQTIQTFLEKFLSPNELYQTEFLKGLQDAQTDVETGQFEEVASFDEFIN